MYPLTPNQPNRKRKLAKKPEGAAGSGVTKGGLLARLQAADPFPNVWHGKLRYSGTFTLTTDGTVAQTIGSEQTFKLNSLYDPDLTNLGHQPFGYDQLTPIYRKYSVQATTVDLEFFGSNSDDVVALFTVQSGQNTTALAASNVDAARERQSVMARNMPINGENRWRHVETFPIHVVEGRPKQLTLIDDAYMAAVTSDPTNVVYLRMAAAATVNTGKAVNVNVILTFHCTMFARISMAQS